VKFPAGHNFYRHHDDRQGDDPGDAALAAVLGAMKGMGLAAGQLELAVSAAVGE